MRALRLIGLAGLLFATSALASDVRRLTLLPCYAGSACTLASIDLAFTSGKIVFGGDATQFIQNTNGAFNFSVGSSKMLIDGSNVIPRVPLLNDLAELSLADSVILGVGGTAIGSSMRGTATLDFASAAAGACSAVLTITVTGAVADTEVALGVPNVSEIAGSQFTARVSATNTVSVKHCCNGAGPCDPASGSFAARVFNP